MYKKFQFGHSKYKIVKHFGDVIASICGTYSTVRKRAKKKGKTPNGDYYIIHFAVKISKIQFKPMPKNDLQSWHYFIV